MTNMGVTGRGILAIAALLAAPAARAESPQQATATGITTASIVAPLTVVELQDLDFGVVVGASAGASAGSVTVSPDGAALRYTGAAQPGCADTCPSPHAAAFAVSGEAGRSYLVALPATLLVAPEADAIGAIPLRIGALAVRSRSGSTPATTGTLDSAGQDHFTIGATLEVPAGAAAGHYRVNLPVVVTYS